MYILLRSEASPKMAWRGMSERYFMRRFLEKEGEIAPPLFMVASYSTEAQALARSEVPDFPFFSQLSCLTVKASGPADFRCVNAHLTPGSFCPRALRIFPRSMFLFGPNSSQPDSGLMSR